MIDKETRIDVEAVKSLLLHQKTSKEYFKWPLTQQQAEDLLLAAYMAEVESRNRVYIDDSNTRNNISRIARHLVAPKKFGLMLAGTCGNGKTSLLKAIQSATNFLNLKYEVRSDKEEKIAISIIDVKDIIANCKDYQMMEVYKKTPYLGIDDMGKEPKEVLDYGNVCNPVIDLIEYRYDKQLTTFITTNLTPEEFKDKYGERITDRFREMIEKIVFNDGSYRK